MTSTRPKHIEASSDHLEVIEHQNAPCSLEPEPGQSPSAAMEKTALNHVSEDLMEQIVGPHNLAAAWKRVKANRGAPGPDGITLDDFPEHWRQQWPVIKQQLLEGTYRPSPARRKSISKEDGGERNLGIPNVMERLIQQAILQVLTPIFDPSFSESSFGFRPGRSVHGAIKQVQAHIQAGYRHCVDMDLSKFFDRVQHDVLLVRVARKVRDKRLLKLIGRYLRAGVMVDTELQPSIEGTMQGGPLSPLLANILLDDFDKELERRGHRFVRYADDFLVFTKTSEAARRVYDSIGRYLTRKLKLVINQQKSRTCSTDGVEFLGFIFHGYGGRMGVSPKNKKKFKDRVKEITRRNRGVRISSRFKELRQYFHGWVGYFRNGLAKTQLTDLDQWVRRRIRACYWKQWRRIRTKIRQLIKLEVRPTEAISHGCSSKGAWVMSSSHALHAGLSIDYLTQQGLASLLDIWSKFASKKRIA